MKLTFNNITENLNHSFTLISQVRWSKNITEERDSPKQILIGSYNEKLCVLLNLAIYLELYGEMENINNSFIYGNGESGDRIVRNLLKNILGNLSYLYSIINLCFSSLNVHNGSFNYLISFCVILCRKKRISKT